MFLIFSSGTYFSRHFSLFSLLNLFHTVATYDANVIRVILPYICHAQNLSIPDNAQYYILPDHIRTNPSAPAILLSEIFYFFLKVCALDETLVLLAFFFAGTVTYVPEESIFHTMAVLAPATTPSYGSLPPMK